jgi:hypothetical protein
VRELTLRLPGLTREERNILLRGCLMNDYRMSAAESPEAGTNR